MLLRLKVSNAGRSRTELSRAAITPNAPNVPMSRIASRCAKRKLSSPMAVVRDVNSTGTPVAPTA